MKLGCWNVCDLLDMLWGVLFDFLLQLVATEAVFGDVVFIDPAILEQEMLDAVQQGHVRTDSRRQMDCRLLRTVAQPWVYYDQGGWIGSFKPVQDPSPQNGLGSTHIVPDLKVKGIPVSSHLEQQELSLAHKAKLVSASRQWYFKPQIHTYHQNAICKINVSVASRLAV